MLDLEAIELIKQLKSRYFRALDTADLTTMETVFTSDGLIHYQGPSYNIEHQGWDALATFFTTTFTERQFGVHIGVNPEISVDGDSATGIWYLRDTFVNLEHQVQFEGSAIYRDEYVKVDGQWRISASRYQRLFEQISPIPKGVHHTGVPTKLKSALGTSC
ncbi:nuclear transport factor 2 family protein [Ferrimonas pelagia]|uniref:Nuclear transport factor 2 family protein n=1 Tax=Ferrimonas pelagia TaxID=1177826 RepID=A0ABP9ENJ9_9GAMM